jgi:hypothetical protein
VSDSDNIHVVPVWQEHVCTGFDCWCLPRYMIPCDECEEGCWKCEGGEIWVTREEAEASDLRVIIVHYPASHDH